MKQIMLPMRLPDAVQPKDCESGKLHIVSSADKLDCFGERSQKGTGRLKIDWNVYWLTHKI
ncbi:hypothetical protein ACVNHC_04655 [Pannonibacter sp. Q-1]|uniref:hypothetical protein n=1 Tax=Pannonibacter phragmitetus TaxID=121719 RepID=UPI0012FE2788|nr:hypothetical protein [Pannonibacter phragmitetus]